MSSGNLCVKCEKCALCYLSGGVEKCYTCKIGKFLDKNNDCVTDCGATEPYYPNTQTNKCAPCSPACTLCYGPSNAECTECHQNTTIKYYLLNTTHQCLETCPSGYYPNDAFKNCTLCQGCHSCADGSTCTSCPDGTYLKGTTCVASDACGNPYYADPTTNICQKCHDGCAICTGPLSTQCSQCTGNYMLVQALSSCVLACPNGYFNNQPSNTCDPCEETSYCATCPLTSATTCTSCKSGYFLSLSDSSCGTGCVDTKQYPDQVLGRCMNCHTYCQECTGPTMNECSKCAYDGTNSVYLYVLDLTNALGPTCSGSCPDSFYAEFTEGKCKECDSLTKFCQTCSNAVDCKSCIDGYFLIGKVCVDACTGPYYNDTATRTCKKCSNVCPTCFGPSTAECNSCTTYNSIAYYLHEPTYACLTICPSGYARSAEADHKCLPCQDCLTCDINLNTKCTSCAPGTFLTLGLCKTTCPDGTYRNTTTNKCENCNVACQNCSGPLNTQCNICNTNFYLYSTTCSSSCPAGYYKLSQKCEQCISQCKTCTSPTDCTSCNPGYFYFSG